jgi:hypothetical protein
VLICDKEGARGGVEGKCGVRKGRGRMMMAWACEGGAKAEDDSTDVSTVSCLARQD